MQKAVTRTGRPASITAIAEAELLGQPVSPLSRASHSGNLRRKSTDNQAPQSATPAREVAATRSRRAGGRTTRGAKG